MVSSNPFINSFLDEATGDVARSELSVGEHDLPFGVLLTVAFVNIRLANQAIANEISV